MKSSIKKLKSLQNFEVNLNRTCKLIHGLVNNVIETKILLAKLIDDKKLDSKSKKIAYSLILDKEKLVDKENKAYLYEVGYISLFSHFEFFMFDFLKELFLKFPKSLPENRIIKLDEISEFKSVNKIKEYILDSIAVEKSYEPKEWSEFLFNKFGIKFFKGKKDLFRVQVLNELRNAFMHSGGKVNSKIRNKMKTITKDVFPLNSKITVNREKIFNIFYFILKDILRNFKKS